MGHRQVEQAALFYEFSLERHVPAAAACRVDANGGVRKLVHKPSRALVLILAHRQNGFLIMGTALLSRNSSKESTWMAEGVRLGSNGLRICSNNIARASATGIQLLC